MAVKTRRMYLKDVLQKHGIYTIRDLRECSGLSSQYAFLLWWGMRGLGRKTIQLLHERCHIPLEELMQVKPGPGVRGGPRPPRKRPPETPPEA
jgi:hypothetical protein